MRLLVQRAKKAAVHVDGKCTGSIEKGLVVFFAVHKEDEASEIDWYVKKMLNLRIFPDTEGKMNRSLLDVEGAVLIVSQFTLYGDCRNGRRPSFTNSAKGDDARQLYDQFVEECKKNINIVQTGVFAAQMEVSLINDGPITLLIER
jgi:D-tyrosyl-tRNA(Tyr) deacylase